MFECFRISKRHMKCLDDIRWNLADFSCRQVMIPSTSFKKRRDKRVMIWWTNNTKIEMSGNEFFFSRWAYKSNRDSEKITTEIVLEYQLYQRPEQNVMFSRFFSLLYWDDHYVNRILICAEQNKRFQPHSH